MLPVMFCRQSCGHAATVDCQRCTVGRMQREKRGEFLLAYPAAVTLCSQQQWLSEEPQRSQDSAQLEKERGRLG